MFVFLNLVQSFFFTRFCHSNNICLKIFKITQERIKDFLIGGSNLQRGFVL